MAFRGERIPEDVVGLTMTVIQFAALLMICIGAARMGHLKSIRQSWLAAVLSCIPGVSPFFILGIPFGIWSIVLLRNDRIRNEFLPSNATAAESFSE